MYFTWTYFFFLFQSDIKSIYCEKWNGYVWEGKPVPHTMHRKATTKKKKNRNQKYFPIVHCIICRYTLGCEFCFFIGENFMPWKMLGESDVQWMNDTKVLDTVPYHMWDIAYIFYMNSEDFIFFLYSTWLIHELFSCETLIMMIIILFSIYAFRFYLRRWAEMVMENRE